MYSFGKFGIWSAHVSVYGATLDVLDLSAPVNKFPVGTAERHLRHQVNLNINYDNKCEPKKSLTVAHAHIVCLLFVKIFTSQFSSRDSKVAFI